MSLHSWAGDPARHRLVEQLRRLAPGAHVLRIQADGSVTAYRRDRTIVRGSRTTAQDARIYHLLRGYYEAVDWRAPHDMHLADGMLRAAPGPGQRGHWPAKDGAFGSAPGPVTLRGSAGAA